MFGFVNGGLLNLMNYDIELLDTFHAACMKFNFFYKYENLYFNSPFKNEHQLFFAKFGINI